MRSMHADVSFVETSLRDCTMEDGNIYAFSIRFFGILLAYLDRLAASLTKPGLRWAPATLLDRVDRGWPTIDVRLTDPGVLTPNDGLIITFSGFRLSLPQRPNGLSPSLEPPTKDLEIAFVRDEYGSWSFFKNRSAPEQESSDEPVGEFTHDSTFRLGGMGHPSQGPGRNVSHHRGSSEY